MTTLLITTRDGTDHRIKWQADLTLMEVIRDSGIDELLALCGGCCSCATCHVYVGASGGELMKDISEDENDLLESSSHRTISSRLACQVRFKDHVGQMHVLIAPED